MNASVSFDRRSAISSPDEGGGPDGGAGEPVLTATGRPCGLPTRPALVDDARARPSITAKRQLVVSTLGRQTRLPLVRQRVNYNDEGTQQVPILGASPACRNPGAEHQCQFNQPGIRISGRQIRLSAQRVSGASRRTPQFETRAPDSNTRIRRCEDGAPPSNSRAWGAEARARPKNTRPIGPSRLVLRHQTFEAVALRPTFHRQRVEASGQRSKLSTSDRGMRLFGARRPRSAVRA